MAHHTACTCLLMLALASSSLAMGKTEVEDGRTQRSLCNLCVLFAGNRNVANVLTR